MSVEHRQARPTAFSRRDYLTLAAFGLFWLGMVVRFAALLIRDRSALGLMAAGFSFFSWICWMGFTYRRAALYVMPVLLLGCTIAGALELLLGIESGEVAWYLGTVAVCGALYAVVFSRRRLYV